MFRVHQYRVRITYKSRPGLFIVDWLSRQNHTENKDTEILGMQLNTDAIQTTTNIPECTTIQQLHQATSHAITYSS